MAEQERQNAQDGQEKRDRTAEVAQDGRQRAILGGKLGGAAALDLGARLRLATRAAYAALVVWWSRLAQGHPQLGVIAGRMRVWLREAFSIRARLAIWCATIMAMILLLLSFVTYTIAANQLEGSVVGNIRDRAQAIGNALMSEQSTSQVLPTPVVPPTPVPTLPDTPTPGGPTPSPVSTPDPASQAKIQQQLSLHIPEVLGRLDLGFEVLDSQGQAKYVAATLGANGMPLNPEIVNAVLRGAPATWYTAPTPPQAGTPSSTLAIYVQPLVYRQSPVAAKQIVGVVLAARTLDDSNAALETLKRLLLIGDVIAILLASLGGWFIAERGLRPVTTVTRTARAIAVSAHAAGLETRVPYEGPRDEVGELVTTFNDMLDALERVTVAQRRFVSDASHELRAPLTSLKSNLEYLRRVGDAAETERSAVLSDAESEATRLATLVGDLLLLARVDAASASFGPSRAWLDEQLRGRREPVALDEVVMGVFRQCRAQMTVRRKNLRLSVRKLQPMTVMGDPGQIRQIVYILVDNAIKYTPNGGKVSLSLTRDDDDWARITVEDTGVGIAKEHLPHIFERFYRVDVARRTGEDSGSGLGLAIAHELVELHCGRIDVSSTPGEGSCFAVGLQAEPQIEGLVLPGDSFVRGEIPAGYADASTPVASEIAGAGISADMPADMPADMSSAPPVVEVAAPRGGPFGGAMRQLQPLAQPLAQLAASVSQTSRPTLRQLRAVASRRVLRDPSVSSTKHHSMHAPATRLKREKRQSTPGK